MDRKRLLRNPLLWVVALLLVYYAFSTLFDDKAVADLPNNGRDFNASAKPGQRLDSSPPGG